MTPPLPAPDDISAVAPKFASIPLEARAAITAAICAAAVRLKREWAEANKKRPAEMQRGENAGDGCEAGEAETYRAAVKTAGGDGRVSSTSLPRKGRPARKRAERPTVTLRQAQHGRKS